jgi:hypothetical protein
MKYAGATRREPCILSPPVGVWPPAPGAASSTPGARRPLSLPLFMWRGHFMDAHRGGEVTTVVGGDARRRGGTVVEARVQQRDSRATMSGGGAIERLAEKCVTVIPDHGCPT